MVKNNFNIFQKFFKGKKIIITGHTGFKGSWLSLWLSLYDTKILGISNGYPCKPNMFQALNLKKKIKHKIIDIRNLKLLKKEILKFQPDIIFHLAAQAIVKKSYDDPATNWQTNTIGSINILESLRYLKKKCVGVIVTSDKSYLNLEVKRGYVENDILGGDDPYSASKAAAELAFKSYVKSFFSNKNNKIFLSSVRAGNVIGGGDWSDHRLIPDCIKSWSKNNPVQIRNPNSTRPWQHVLEAIYGYLVLATNLSKNKKIHGESFNFGPNANNNYKVVELVNEMSGYWKNIKWKINKKKNSKFKEAKLLKINSNKAKRALKWNCIMNFRDTAKLVSEWYRNYYIKKVNNSVFTINQIKFYINKLKNLNQ